MKGICHIWSRGRHLSPSLPGDGYLNLGSKSDLRAEISGSIVWYDALAPRPEVLLSFSGFYANNVSQVPFSLKKKIRKITGVSLAECIARKPKAKAKRGNTSTEHDGRGEKTNIIFGRDGERKCVILLIQNACLGSFLYHIVQDCSHQASNF